MDEIVARFRWTVDELIAARRWHYRCTTRPFFRAALWAFSIFVVVAGLAIFFHGQIGDGAMVAGFGCLIALGLAVGTPWSARWQFRRRPDQNVEFEWRMKPDNIQIIGPHSKTEANWNAFQKIAKTPKGFLFYSNPQVFHWIPRHAFASDADFVQIPQFAEKHGLQVVDSQDNTFRRRFRFQTKNILWAMFFTCIWAGAFSFLRTFVIQHRPLNDLPWTTIAVAVCLPLLLTVSMPAVAIGTLFGRTRAGAMVGLILIAVCLILFLVIML